MSPGVYTLDDFDLRNVPEATDADRERIAEYVRQFADTRHEEGTHGGIDCPGCGKRIIVHDLMFVLGGGVRWGLVNGEAECVRCGWPIGVYHRVPLECGETLRWNMLMAYAPAEEAAAASRIADGDSQSTQEAPPMSFQIPVPPLAIDPELASKIAALQPPTGPAPDGSDQAVQIAAAKDAALSIIETGAIGQGYVQGTISGHVHEEGTAPNYVNVALYACDAPAVQEPTPADPPADDAQPAPADPATEPEPAPPIDVHDDAGVIPPNGAEETHPEGVPPLEAGGSNPSGANRDAGVSSGPETPQEAPVEEPVEAVDAGTKPVPGDDPEVMPATHAGVDGLETVPTAGLEPGKTQVGDAQPEAAEHDPSAVEPADGSAEASV